MKILKILKIQELVQRYHVLLLLASLLLVFAVEAFVISQRHLSLSEGISSTWWMIVKNVESGQGYKACDVKYVPNCDLTDQTTAMREPVPVLFFALVGILTHNSTLAFQVSQLIFNLLICLFMYLLGRELGSLTLGLVAAFGWAIYLHAVHTVLHINGDLMAGFFVLAGVLAFTQALKKRTVGRWILFGILFGLAVLSRSSTVLIFLVLAVGSIVYLRRTRMLQSEWYKPLLAVVLFGLVLLPWVVRNEMVFGKPVWGTTLVGYNLYRFNAIVTTEVPPHYVGPGEGYGEIKTLVAQTPELRRPINEAKVDEILQKKALNLIRTHPEEYAELVAFRFLPLWFNIGILDQYGETPMIIDNLIVLQQAILLAAFLFALWKADWYLRLLAVGALFFMFGYLAVDAQLRYMVTIMPLIIVISATGIHRFFLADDPGTGLEQFRETEQITRS